MRTERPGTGRTEERARAAEVAAGTRPGGPAAVVPTRRAAALSRRAAALSRLAAAPSRLGPVVRRHWMVTVLLALGLVLRVLVMVAYRPAIFYIDSVASYLLPLPKLDPTGEDPIGYDIYLLGPVGRLANLTTVVAVQHLLGLGMAIAGYALLVHKGAWRWLAALATVPVLLDAYQLQIEQNIMPEPLFEALLVAALVALVWQPRPGWPTVIAAGMLLGFAVTVRQAGELLVLPLVLYPLLAGGAWRQRLARGATAVTCFLLPVAGYALYYHSFTGEYAISHVGGNALYGRVATFADCAASAIPDDELPLCPTVPRGQRPGPDYWAHDPASPYFALQKLVGNDVDKLAKDFSLRIIQQQPLDFARSVGGDAVKVFSWNHSQQAATDPPVDRWQFQVDMPLFLPLVSTDEITQLSHRYGDGDPATVAGLTTLLRGYQLHGGYTPGPLVALAVLLALLPLVRWRRSGAARLPALLFLMVGGSVLLSGDLVVFSWRYQLPGYVLLPVAGALGLTAVRDWRGPAVATPERAAAATGAPADTG